MKKRPGQLVIRKRVSLVFRKLQDTSRVKCKCKVTGEDTEAFAEDEVKSDSAPIEGRCKSKMLINFFEKVSKKSSCHCVVVEG